MFCSEGDTEYEAGQGGGQDCLFLELQPEGPEPGMAGKGQTVLTVTETEASHWQSSVVGLLWRGSLCSWVLDARCAVSEKLASLGVQDR